MRSTLSTFDEIWQRQFRAHVLKQADQFSSDCQFLIGCSGGMDSMLLLHLMHQLFPTRIRAIYIDHQLQSLSHQWAQFVESQCAAFNIPYQVEKVQIATGNLENAARDARYAAFQRHLNSQDILVLAHHQQDQAETVLLRLLSGSGIQGLSAMKAIDQRDSLHLWRPMLNLSRQQIEQWVKQLQILHVEDPSNLDTHYDRAWCRQSLWPMLEQRYPKMQSAVARTASLMQDAQEILNEVITLDREHCIVDDVIQLDQLGLLTEARRRQLLSEWMKGEGQYRPSYELVEKIQNEVIQSKTDAQAALHFSGQYFVRFQNKLYRIDKQIYLNKDQAQSAHSEFLTFQLNVPCELKSGTFKIEQCEIGLDMTLLGRELEIKTRQGGEKIHLYGRVGKWPLKKAIHEAQIFPWLRHTIQILTVDNVMLGVFTPKGFWLAQSPYCVENGWVPQLLNHLDI